MPLMFQHHDAFMPCRFMLTRCCRGAMMRAIIARAQRDAYDVAVARCRADGAR